jgi:hypothetical protein
MAEVISDAARLLDWRCWLPDHVRSDRRLDLSFGLSTTQNRDESDEAGRKQQR